MATSEMPYGRSPAADRDFQITVCHRIPIQTRRSADGLQIKLQQFRTHLTLIAGALFMGLPLVLMFVSVTHDGGFAARGSVSLVPGQALGRNLQGLSDVIVGNAAGPTLNQMLATSLISGAGVAVATTVVSFLAAYAMTFLKLPGARFWFWLTLLTLYFPVEARMLPTFEVAAQLGLINTHLGLILPVLPLALGTFVFRQHMKTFPPEYLEAARLDGVRSLGFLKDFVVPLSWVPIGAVLVITFVVGWNQYIWPLMIAIDNSQFTLMRGLGLLGSGSGPSMVLAAISILPPLALVLVFQRRIMGLYALRD